VFLALPLPNSPNSIWLKFTAVVENAAPDRAPRGVARHGTQPPPPPPSLLLSWRNTRSELLWPILFCIFGMCSPRRKSAATVRTVWRYLICVNSVCIWQLWSSVYFLSFSITKQLNKLSKVDECYLSILFVFLDYFM
jgi:hypothetical protein